jgi:hypothetical protein
MATSGEFGRSLSWTFVDAKTNKRNLSKLTQTTKRLAYDPPVAFIEKVSAKFIKGS